MPTIVEALNQRLIDSLDLYTQFKVAHWNIRGPHFVALHPLFDQIAQELNGFIDEIAERAIVLGGHVIGTARTVAKQSTIEDYPETTVRDLEHVALLGNRLDQWLVGMKHTRDQADEAGDPDTADLLTGMISAFDKHRWFFRATLG